MPGKLTSQAAGSAEAPGGRAQPSAQDTALRSESLKAGLRGPEPARQGDGVRLPLLLGPLHPTQGALHLTQALDSEPRESLHCVHVRPRSFSNKPRVCPPKLDAQFPVLRPLPLLLALGGLPRPPGLYRNDTCSQQPSKAVSPALVARTCAVGVLTLREHPNHLVPSPSLPLDSWQCEGTQHPKSALFFFTEAPTPRRVPPI